MEKKYNPKVSVVIPIYNGSNYMRQAIDSALAQTYRNIEIIVVNDGSKDDGKTDKIALSYGDKIKYIKKENGGVSTALNLAIQKMTGEYFSWLSHDDVYYPNKIEKQINFLQENNIKDVILYSDYELIDKKSRLIGESIKDHNMLHEKPEYALLRGSVNGITLLIPKSAFNKYGLFNENLKCTQDYDMWNKMIKTYKFIHMPIILTKTRIHSEQDTHKHPKVNVEGDLLWIKMIKDLSSEDKKRLEGSEYNFYMEMNKFLKDTPYKRTVEYVNGESSKILKSQQKKLNNIKVTIVIPFYNRIDLVVQSLSSAQRQTHKNLEIVLINDGSTDDISILLNIIKKDNRVKLINLKENRGPSIARNKGIEMATGDYIAFLDSDDFFVENKIEIQLLQMLLNNSILSHTSYTRRYDGIDIIINSGSLNGKVIPTLIYSCKIATPTVMVQKKFLHDAKIRYNENYTIGEDICFYLEILRNNNILGIDQPLTIVNASSNSAAYNCEKQIVGIKNILKFVLSDEQYRKEDYAIAKLCSYLCNLYLQGKIINSHDYVDIDNLDCPNCQRIKQSRSWKITKPIRGVAIIYRLLKKYGLVIITKKIVNRLFRKWRKLKKQK